MNIFEKSVDKRTACPLTQCDVKNYSLKKDFLRENDADLPEVDELTAIRHYTELSKKAFGVDDGFYPLGSCTMKYNPKINELVAGYEGFVNIHPLQQDNQGALMLIKTLEHRLCQITGMDAYTMQPAAGAHGEFTAMLMIRAFHKNNNDTKRNKVIVPDSAHGTNPASANMAGFEIINIPSSKDGLVDIEQLELAVGEDTAALMLTNPNTLGIFDKNIKKIAEIVHNAGGLLYYDGANLNPIMGIIRPGDMGFDLVHLNLHKTFSTPHGGGGPGSGPVGCKEYLKAYLPNPVIDKTSKGLRFSFSEKSIGRMLNFYGNFAVLVKALAYIETLGLDGLRKSAKAAVLNANYLLAKIKDIFPSHSGDICMHEFVVSLENLKKESGVSAMDFAKGLIDYGIHPPTMYFPLIVKEALMFEPTETESKETLDKASRIIKELYELAKSQPNSFHIKPQTTPISRPDEVSAARAPIVTA
ncbi:MAG: aminomethyl-transferring glycine dehydrogenase subunit GcvPB [Bacillota bacterium]